MIKSVRVNPAWVARQTKTNADVSHIAAQTKAAISDSLVHGWEERGAIMDRVMQEGSCTRLGIGVYADPATGIQYTVANSRGYYWVDASGTVVGTDTDTAPDVSFSRLNRTPNRCRHDAHSRNTGETCASTGVPSTMYCGDRS